MQLILNENLKDLSEDVVISVGTMADYFDRKILNNGQGSWLLIGDYELVPVITYDLPYNNFGISVSHTTISGGRPVFYGKNDNIEDLVLDILKVTTSIYDSNCEPRKMLLPKRVYRSKVSQQYWSWICVYNYVGEFNDVDVQMVEYCIDVNRGEIPFTDINF